MNTATETRTFGRHTYRLLGTECPTAAPFSVTQFSAGSHLPVSFSSGNPKDRTEACAGDKYMCTEDRTEAGWPRKYWQLVR